MVVSTASKVSETLNSFTSKPNGIPGVVFRAVTKDGTLLYEGSSGVLGIDHQDQPMTSDTVFWIASLTKLLTAVAALQLREQGKIDLSDTVERYLPEIGKIQILTGFDADDRPILQDQTTKMTIWHLLTHTAGFNYNFYNELTKKFSEMNNISKLTPSDISALYGPLSFQPGTSWEYGTSIDWLGLVIEKISEKTLGDYMQQYIFEPLGIHSTTFEPVGENSARIHFRAPNKRLVEVDPKIFFGEKVALHLGGSGAYSTASDYTTVLVALLNGGIGRNGQRILKKESVDLLFLDQGISADKLAAIPLPFDTPNKAWTFGGMMFNSQLPSGRSAGSVWWAGAAGCYWWLDFKEGIAGVILAQIIPPLDREVVKCLAACEKLIYSGMKTGWYQ
eukprot:Phypoly_transcript_04351.p1 GENE.Phypoly_transcript_04351~~Phypoly_transcript_04351.p1  ORF type:complete len:391 (+),score=58.17 Phypoly_transcript_04351:36-1208(+)